MGPCRPWIALGLFETFGDALIDHTSVYLAVVGVEGYVVTPYVMGRSLDMNGTTVLIACLFWGFLWGLVGLVLAVPITVCMKLVFQSIPELNRWAELMSCQWQTPVPAPRCRTARKRPGPTSYHKVSPGKGCHQIELVLHDPGRSSRFNESMLHVTNGDSAAGVLVQTGLPGDVIPWRDVLHEGPVSAWLSSEELRRARARFLASCGWGDERLIHATLSMRDLVLDDLAERPEVVLWFETDLYDQLQLLQVLDRLARRPELAIPISLVRPEGTGDTSFVGLGSLTPPDFVRLFPNRRRLSADALRSASSAWDAFVAPDPSALESIAWSHIPELPDVPAALRRLLEEYPSTEGGLSRTERASLEILADGPRSFHELFRGVNDREEKPFLGDTTFLRCLQLMGSSARPLIDCRATDVPTAEAESADYAFSVTEAGRDVLAGRADHVRLNGIERWIGGVHLAGPESLFRWNPRIESLEKAESDARGEP